MTISHSGLLFWATLFSQFGEMATGRQCTELLLSVQQHPCKLISLRVNHASTIRGECICHPWI